MSPTELPNHKVRFHSKIRSIGKRSQRRRFAGLHRIASGTPQRPADLKFDYMMNEAYLAINHHSNRQTSQNCNEIWYLDILGYIGLIWYELIWYDTYIYIVYMHNMQIKSIFHPHLLRGHLFQFHQSSFSTPIWSRGVLRPEIVRGHEFRRIVAGVWSQDESWWQRKCQWCSHQCFQVQLQGWTFLVGKGCPYAWWLKDSDLIVPFTRPCVPLS